MVPFTIVPFTEIVLLLVREDESKPPPPLLSVFVVSDFELFGIFRFSSPRILPSMLGLKYCRFTRR